MSTCRVPKLLPWMLKLVCYSLHYPFFLHLICRVSFWCLHIARSSWWRANCTTTIQRSRFELGFVLVLDIELAPSSMSCISKSSTDLHKHPSRCGQRRGSVRIEMQAYTASHTYEDKIISITNLCTPARTVTAPRRWTQRGRRRATLWYQGAR